MMRYWSPAMVAGAMAFSVAAPAARAGSVMTVQWDLNSLVATASGGVVDSSFTGSLAFEAGASTELRAVLVNDGSDGSFVAPVGMTVSGLIQWDSGVVAPGSVLSFAIDNDGIGGLDDFFTATIVAGSGGIITDFGDPSRLILGAAIADISLTQADASTFSGVAIPDFFPTGSLIEFKLDKNLINAGTRTDSSTDVDLFGAVLVPMPSAAGLGVLGLMAIGLVRRRSP